MSPDAALGVGLLVPLATALLVAFSGSRPNLRETFTLLGTLGTAWFVFQLIPFAQDADPPRLELFAFGPNITIGFALEPLGALYAAVASGLWILTSLYAIGYMRAHHEQHQTRFFTCFALSIFGALGIAFSANLLTLFLFYELLTFATYPLVTHYGTEQALKAGRIYLGLLVTTSVVGLLFGIIWTFQLSGTVDFRPGGILADKASPAVVTILLALFMFGTGKAALMPFHRWLPNAMVAPTPVSALLHAVAVVKAGVFTVLKVIVYVFGLDLLNATHASDFLMYVAAFTLLVASAIAIAQDNLKARLAYSTISHLSYIVLGGALATPGSVVGGGLHIAMHAMAKITLFFCAGAIYVTAHKTKVSELNGLGRKMPFTMLAFLLASLSLIGLPPFGGVWSKWHLALGAVEGGNTVFMYVLMASSLLSIAYLIPVVARAFFLPPPAAPEQHDETDAHAHSADHGEAPWLCLVPLCATAVGCVVLFFYAQPIYRLLKPIVGG